MEPIPAAAQTALSQFMPIDSIESIRFLGNAGGFSGAQLWRIDSQDNEWCLRRWPTTHPSKTQLDWIQHVLFHAARNGVNFVPLPCHPMTGSDAYCRVEGAFWELAPWMPGKADYWQHPSNKRLVAAMRGLATFHAATRDFAPHRFEAAPGLLSRERQLGDWKRQLNDAHLVARLNNNSRFAQPALEIVRLMPTVLSRCERMLARAPRRCLVRPCLRDVWHDHVLFQDDELSAFVDFGAMRFDSVAVDLARLLGSLVGDDPSGWRLGLQAYQDVIPLAEEDRNTLAAIDLANSILGGANWIRWIFVENRQFENVDGIQERLNRIIDRLKYQADIKSSL